MEDFLARRTRLAFLDVAAAEAAVNRVSVAELRELQGFLTGYVGVGVVMGRDRGGTCVSCQG